MALSWSALAYTKPAEPKGGMVIKICPLNHDQECVAKLAVADGAGGFDAAFASGTHVKAYTGVPTMSMQLKAATVYIQNIQPTIKRQLECAGYHADELELLYTLVDQLVASGIQRELAVHLHATSWAHTDQCPNLLTQLLEVQEKLQAATQALVTLTVMSVNDQDPDYPGSPMFLVWEEKGVGGKRMVKHACIPPGGTVVMEAKAAFLIKHQMFALPGTTSLRLRGCWVPGGSGASGDVRQLVAELQHTIEDLLVAEAQGDDLDANLLAAFGEMLSVH
ncbi:hypothetical protein HT031_003871 [Scenedesmus sp. PABB004]|nr:hypothetical protein HT031_003871 [Scenedesmus sp. PABB004]